MLKLPRPAATRALPLALLMLATACGSGGDASGDKAGNGEVSLDLAPPEPLNGAASAAADADNAIAGNVAEPVPVPEPVPPQPAPQSPDPAPKEEPNPPPPPAPEREPEPAAEAEEAPAPRGARPPLSDATIARTIDRIGFSCGSVTSTAAAGAGSYRIECSSGETFRGSSRGGRFRFRPWRSGDAASD